MLSDSTCGMMPKTCATGDFPAEKPKNFSCGFIVVKELKIVFMNTIINLDQAKLQFINKAM